MVIIGRNWVGTTLSATCWPSGSQRPHFVGDISAIPILYHVKGLNHHIEF